MASRAAVLPGKFPTYEYIAMGAIGWICKLSNRVAVKLAREPDAIGFAKENSIFLRIPNANFIAFISGGFLNDRLRLSQVRDNPFGKVLCVEKTEPVQLVERWLRELTGAVVWLESLGDVHGDLRPNNFLLDARDHLDLGDFDRAEKIGKPSSGNAPPWARVLGDGAEHADEVGGQRGSFGINGPRTEQFSIGSNLYCMVYGFEPYDDRDDEGPVIVGLLQDLKSPKLRGGRLDGVIDRCWRGHYH